MPETTPKLGLKKPLGNESFNRQSYNENLDLLDQNVETPAGAQAKADAAETAAKAYADQAVGSVQNDINEHSVDNVKHVTQTEKDIWNGKVDLSVVNAHLADVAKYTHNGVRKEYTWDNGLPTQERYYDASNNIIKLIDYTWSNGLPDTETYTLKDYNGLNELINTQTFVVTYTWLNGLPTQEIIS